VGRYIETMGPRNAQLLIAVRSGHIASASPGVRIETGGQRSTTVGPVGGLEVGPAHDYLVVYESQDGQARMPLWREMEAHGLEGFNPPLVAHLRKEVDAISPPAKKP
jgi:hypothetical protein